eukprot:6245559-Amphidinium_carterae.1
MFGQWSIVFHCSHGGYAGLVWKDTQLCTFPSLLGLCQNLLLAETVAANLNVGGEILASLQMEKEFYTMKAQSLKPQPSGAERPEQPKVAACTPHGQRKKVPEP